MAEFLLVSAANALKSNQFFAFKISDDQNIPGLTVRARDA